MSGRLRACGPPSPLLPSAFPVLVRLSKGHSPRIASPQGQRSQCNCLVLKQWGHTQERLGTRICVYCRGSAAAGVAPGCCIVRCGAIPWCACHRQLARSTPPVILKSCAMQVKCTTRPFQGLRAEGRRGVIVHSHSRCIAGTGVLRYA